MRAEIPPHCDQDESRYFSIQRAGREQMFLHTVSRMRAGISPSSEQEESRHSNI
jgi:hypothetical protein